MILLHGILGRARKLYGLPFNAAAEVEKFPERRSGDIEVYSPEEVWARSPASKDGARRPSGARPDRPMISVSGIRFDHHHYDEPGDVLYLNVGVPRTAAHALETPEGHAVHYDEAWAVIGLTLLNVRWTLQRDGELTLTWPPARVGPDQLEAALAGT